ncbi:hypothetical protein D3C85_1655700 [compost metagenome]
MRGHHMFGQCRRQFREGEVGAHYRIRTAAPGQGGAHIVSGEKHIGFGGDLVLIAAGAAKPGTCARIEGFVGIILAVDECQVLIKKQRLG